MRRKRKPRRVRPLLQRVPGDTPRVERARRRLRRGAAEEHRDRRGVVLARAPRAAPAEIAAEPAVHGTRRGSAELHPAELHQLAGGQVGRQRLRQRAAVEREPDQRAR